MNHTLIFISVWEREPDPDLSDGLDPCQRSERVSLFYSLPIANASVSLMPAPTTRHSVSLQQIEACRAGNACSGDYYSLSIERMKAAGDPVDEQRVSLGTIDYPKRLVNESLVQDFPLRRDECLAAALHDVGRVALSKA